MLINLERKFAFFIYHQKILLILDKYDVINFI